MVLVVAVLALVVLLRDGGEEVADGGPIAAPVVPVDPPPAPPLTEPPVTEPPVTEPPATVPVGARTMLEGSFAEITGRFSDIDGGYLAIDVVLDYGQPARFRVEADGDLDVEILVLADRATVRRELEALYPSDPGEPNDFDDWLDDWMLTSRRDLNPGAARTTFGEYFVLDIIDMAWEGEIEAYFHVAPVDGRFTIMTQAVDGAGTARLVVETSEMRFADVSILGWQDFDQPWFYDDRFFWDLTPYRP